jgi:membrane-bound lytic murein transglycosylase F
MNVPFTRACGRALLLALTWLLVMPGNVWAFETINRIKQSGQLKVAVLAGPVRTEDRRLLEGLAQALDSELVLLPMKSHQGLVEALDQGQVDLVGEPVAVGRPWPERHAASRPVRHADLWLVGSAAGHEQATLGLPFASDAWYQALENRRQLTSFELRVASGTAGAGDLLKRVARGEFAATLAYDFELERAGESALVGLKVQQRLQDQVALSWVLRSADRVLRHKVDRYLETWGLTREAMFVDSGDWDAIQQRGRVRMVTLYRPETYFAWSGQLLGLDFELGKAFAARHGLALDVVLARDRKDLEDRLARGEADFGAALLRADQLDKTLSHSQPYYRGQGVLLAPRGRFHQLSPAGLHDATVVLPEDSPYRDQLISWQQAGVRVVINTLPAATDATVLIDQVLAGSADLTIIDKHRYQLESVWRDNIEAVLPVNIEVPRVWAVRSGNPELRRQINQYWDSTLGSWHYNVTVQKYFGASGTSESFRAAFATFARDHAISPYDELVRRYAGYYDFDWRLILAMIFQESRFDPLAVSVSGARGLMQLKPVAARQVGIEDLFDPRQAVHAGVRYLDWLRDRFEPELDVRDRLWFSLAAYNGGLTHIRAARVEAARLGLDNRRWFGNVEQALVALKESGNPTYAGVDVDQIVGYVARISDRYRSYVQLTGVTPPTRATNLAETQTETSRQSQQPVSRIGLLQ